MKFVRKEKYKSDLISEIRTGTDFDDNQGAMEHPYGYGYKGIDENGNEIYDVEFSYCNRYHLLEQFNKVRNHAKAILEIGVGRNGEGSSCYVFITNKKKETIYIGIDLSDKTFLNDQENNVYTIQNDSINYDENLKIFKQIGVEKFDFIHIDGMHTINGMIWDWEYTNLLSDNGIVAIHDVSDHYGPRRFVENIDTSKWNVIFNACPEDHGIAFAWMKK
jgi:hypothetical protein